jgi:membrane associated rhomboid family serine protease
MSNFRPSGLSILPPVVKNLLIINGLCFLANVVLEYRFNTDLNAICGLYYPESKLFKPFQLVTHVFMHGSFTHLFFNMFSLWMFGSVLENFWGGKRFFIYYFVTAFGAAALHTGVNAYEINKIKTEVAAYVAHPNYDSFVSFQTKDFGLAENESFQQFMHDWQQQKDNPQYIQGSVEVAEAIVQRRMNIPTVGASGAVFGLVLAFGMLFPNTELMMIFLPIPIKAKYFVMLYGALELFQGISNNPGDNVAHFAHLGGMLFGFFLIKYWNKKNRNTFY